MTRPDSDTGTRWGAAVGAVADLGVLLPIVLLLVVRNGLSPTAILLPVGVLYLVAGAAYRLPVPVQPMKAMAAVALAAGLSADVIAAAALTVGGLFLLLGCAGLLERCARLMPLAVVRGVQLAVGLALAKVGYGLVTTPAAAFGPQPPPLLAAGAAAILVGVFALYPRVGLAVAMLAALAWTVLAGGASAQLGPAPVSPPSLDMASLGTAIVLLVIPQVPLTLTSSCIATADAARLYYGPRAGRVSPDRLAKTLGGANLLAGTLSGMPMCHGSGGVSAHYRFGGRTGLTPALAGAGAIVVALVFGRAFLDHAAAFPLPLLVALLVVAALAHMRLVLTLSRRRDTAVALCIGLASTVVGLAYLVVVGLVAWWLLPSLRTGPTMARDSAAERRPATAEVATQSGS
ncbi:putative sulfate/molybdate transporter [Georgenia sp. 10Sc9-8]|uniref:Sulfate/molybdate transporter n=1 Tax=Georgenia halotolerans TaxID=3028317 RepID=A0ABT5U1P8_9MICO|nr:putative sulfate/molybdate transporter [Georgenia halotolerans]